MSEIIAKMAELTNLVGQIIPGTEHQFLQIGSRLHHAYSEVESISRQASALVSILDSTAIKRTVESFRDVLDSMERNIGQGQDRFQSGLIALSKVSAAVSNVGLPLANLRKIVKKLKILNISTKIESAQLKKMENDFTNLANDVEELSAMIHEKSTAIENHRVSLMAFTTETLAKIERIYEKNKGYIGDVLANLNESIGMLEGRYELSFAAADSILNRFGATSRQVGEVVMSMQFHDITRQQVEHIGEVLETFRGKIENDRDGGNGIPAAKSLAEAVIVCELQQAQLIDAKDKFTRAVDDITTNLRGIAGNIFKIIEDIHKITGGGTDLTSHSFLANIESGTGMVIGKLEEGTRAQKKFLDTMSELSSAVSTISGLVDNIEEIGEEVELIAVNARIKAAHTGEDGAPLGVIAEAIWHLSTDATSQKSIISDLLRKVVIATQGLEATIIREKTDSDTQGIITELTQILDGLKNMKDETDGLTVEIESGSRRLSDLIENAIDDVTVDKDLARDVAGICRRFDEIIEEARQGVSREDLETARHSSLQYIQENYTMQRERMIHHEIASNIIPVEGKGRKELPKATDQKTGPEDLGDNVELF